MKTNLESCDRTVKKPDLIAIKGAQLIFEKISKLLSRT